MMLVLLGQVCLLFASGLVVTVVADAAVVADVADTIDTPVSAPSPDTRIEYPVRILGTESHDELPDDTRCRWLTSGPDAWVANITTTETTLEEDRQQELMSGKTNRDTTMNKTNTTNTLDGMFRRIVRIYQEGDATYRGKLTVASSPDYLPPRVASDYFTPGEYGGYGGDGEDDDDDDDVYNDDADDVFYEDDPYEFYLHEGDGGPWVLLIDDFLTEEETNRLAELGRTEGYTKSAIRVENEIDEDDLDEDDLDEDDLDEDDLDEDDLDENDLKEDDSDEDDIDEEDYNLYEDDNESDEEEKTKTTRSSSTAWCLSSTCKNDKVYKDVINRVHKLVGIGPSHMENLQLLHYDVGELYGNHHDYYHLPDADKWSQDGGRILTVFLYLNDVEGGGETDFPRLNLTVTPKRGRAVLWPSVLDRNPLKLDWRTEHAALEVTKGVKYGANLWFHQKPYRNKWFNYECDAPSVAQDTGSSTDLDDVDVVCDGDGDGDNCVVWYDDFDAYYDDDDYDDDDYEYDDYEYDDYEYDDYEYDDYFREENDATEES
jgi:prolyl 4-hydroxylase